MFLQVTAFAIKVFLRVIAFVIKRGNGLTI